MIVDDEEHCTELCKALFSSEGFEVVTAYSGEQCLERLKSEKPDLILMDVMMPSINGIETVRRIRKNPETKDIKIVFLTVTSQAEHDRDLLESLHIADYITKPFMNDELVKRMKNILNS